MIRNAVWCLSNLCRGKNPAVDFNKVKEIKTNKT
jgi:importin subunit alpha-2